MTMHYPLSKTTNRATRLLLPVLPIVIAIGLLVARFDMPEMLVGVGHSAAAPVWSVRDTLMATVVATYESLESRAALQRANEALSVELSQLRRESFMSRVFERENEALRSLVGRVTASDALVPAAVINSSYYAPYGSFIVDVGHEQGIGEGDLVLTPEGVSVGSVISVHDASAVVLSFSSPGTALDGVLHASTTLHVRLEGEGSGTLLMTLPRDVVVAVGDQVTLPDFVGSPVGIVSHIETQPEDAFKLVYVTTDVNLFELRYVIIDPDRVWRIDRLDASSTAEAIGSVE